MHESNEATATIPAPSRDVLTEILRDGAQHLLAQAIDAEVAEWIERHVEVTNDGGGGAAAAGGTTTGTASNGGAGGQATRTEPEPTYADTAPTPREPGKPTQTVGTGTHWIEIELVDEIGQPVPAERYRATLPDGQQVAGSLDPRGRVRLEGIEIPGYCHIAFPDLDCAAWTAARYAVDRRAQPG